jgi:hypothetical protein
MTLGKFLDKNLPNLTKGQWKVIASGKLSFKQDLIYSKIINVDHQQKKYSGDNPDDPGHDNSTRPVAMRTPYSPLGTTK